MRSKLLLAVVGVATLAAAGCSLELPEGESGSIALMPVFNQELGIQGVVPAGCAREDADSHDCTGVSPEQSPLIIVQVRVPGSPDELINLVLEQTALTELPEPTRRFRGSAFTWKLYACETQIPESGPETLRLDLALAKDDAAGYLVAMVTLPEDYATHAKWYDSVFSHVVYALSPMNEDV
jgi:hypothetical protein